EAVGLRGVHSGEHAQVARCHGGLKEQRGKCELMDLAVLLRSAVSTANHEELYAVFVATSLGEHRRSDLNSDSSSLHYRRMGFPDRTTKADVLREIQQWMKELFELDSGRVKPDARLVEDLDLDSLDAFDLAVKVEETTGIAFDENQIRELRTVDDVISAIHE